MDNKYKLLLTADEPMKLSVLEVDGDRASSLIKAALYC